MFSECAGDWRQYSAVDLAATHDLLSSSMPTSSLVTDRRSSRHSSQGDQ